MKPILLQAKQAHKTKQVAYRKDGTAVLNLNNKRILVPADHQYDLTQATIFGLNERLTDSATSPLLDASGRTLRDEFNLEWKRYEVAIKSAKDGRLNYGVYAYYPERNDLVRYCDPYWHHLAAVASNSKLVTDPEGKLSWKEIRTIFEQSVVALAGGSVGNSIIHSVIMDVRPLRVKVADKGLYKMENINRVRLGYRDITEPNSKRRSPMAILLRNKAEVIADQIHDLDPFMDVDVYNEGLHEGNLDRFLLGGEGEPRASIVIEEMDDPRLKILVRQKAREYRIPLIMMSDLGSAVQLDVSRYDLDPNLPLTYGTVDEDLLASTKSFYDNPGDRQEFYKFMESIIGGDFKCDELKDFMEGKSEIPTSTIVPQLGSTATAAGGIAGETVARILLGHQYPRRAIFNKRTFEVKIYN